MKYLYFVIILLAVMAELSQGDRYKHHKHHKNNRKPASRSGKSSPKKIMPAPGLKPKQIVPVVCKRFLKDLTESMLMDKEEELMETQEKHLQELEEREHKAELERKRIQEEADSHKEAKERELEEVAKLKKHEDLLTTSVVDSATGKPAVDLKVTISKLDGQDVWNLLSERHTNEVGKVKNVVSIESFTPGTYKFHLDTKAYYSHLGLTTLYPSIDIVFDVTDIEDSYHIPNVIVGPYGYSTYRGVQ